MQYKLQQLILCHLQHDFLVHGNSVQQKGHIFYQCRLMSSSFTSSIMNSGSLETSQAHTPLISIAVPNIMSISTTSDLVINPYNSVALTSPVVTSIARGLIVISVAPTIHLGANGTLARLQQFHATKKFFNYEFLFSTQSFLTNLGEHQKDNQR